MCSYPNFTTPIDFNGPKKVTDKSKETYWPQLASHIDNDAVEFKDLALNCSMCLEDITVFPHEHVEDDNGETHQGVILPCGHIFGASCISKSAQASIDTDTMIRCPTCRGAFVHPKCDHFFFGLLMPSNKSDMGLIPPTLNNGGVLADYCYQCGVKKTLEDLNEELHKILTEESRGRFVVSLTKGGETFPQPWMEDCQEARAPATFRSFVARYDRRLDKYEGSTKLWITRCHAGAAVRIRDLGPQAQ
jgi:hypothetical protein